MRPARRKSKSMVKASKARHGCQTLGCQTLGCQTSRGCQTLAARRRAAGAVRLRGKA